MNMKENTTEQLNSSEVFCPNMSCQARRKIGEGNILIHGKTFSTQVGTMFEGLRKPKALIVIVVMLFAYGCRSRRLCIPSD